MEKGGVELSKLEKSGEYYVYRGKKWRLNKPVKSTAKGKKMMVFATKTINGRKKAKVIHFGALGYGHNYSVSAKRDYLRRSAGIMKKDGTLTKDDPWSANYWARKILWPKNKKTTGPKTTKKAA
ncbi:MAG: hypothetical protein S4CHLAM37_14200 [Chlamydiia bacterium]|nr:hypothetical protein [Chlamydiia bacterium]